MIEESKECSWIDIPRYLILSLELSNERQAIGPHGWTHTPSFSLGYSHAYIDWGQGTVFGLNLDIVPRFELFG